MYYNCNCITMCSVLAKCKDWISDLRIRIRYFPILLASGSVKADPATPKKSYNHEYKMRYKGDFFNH